jgi:glycosyltransferase involved in cell wall biosynthesis
MFWVGSLTAAERRSALTDARVLLAMSCSDGKGTFVKEAMDAGLPVVVSDALTIHAEIEQANAGIAVPVEAGPIARAVGSVLAHPALAAAMAAAGRELIERRYSTTAVARRVLAAYEQACGVASAVEVVPSLDAVGADC